MTQLDDLRKGIEYLINKYHEEKKETKDQIIDGIDSEDAQYLIDQKDKWNIKQVKRAFKIVEKYRKQLPVELREKLDKITSKSIKEEMNRIEEVRRKTINAVKAQEAVDKIAPRTFKTEDGINIYLENFMKINPAQAFHNGIAYITQSLWYDRPIYDKNGNFLGNVKEQGVVVIMSNKKTVLLSKNRNQYGNLLMDVPDTAPDNRFSINAIHRFLTEDIDENPWIAFQMAKEQYTKYMDFGRIPGAYSVSAIYDFLSYFTELFESVPYYWNTGDKGAGKTKDCSIHEQLGFNAFMAVALTAPNLFRIIKDTKGMMVIDENENQGNVNSGRDEDKIAREQILNSGYKKNGKTSRIERNGSKTQRVTYPTYSTKVIGGIRNISDTLRDRSYKFLILKTNREEIANAVVRDSDPVWQQIRDRFYISMLTHLQKFHDIIKNHRVSNKHTFQERTDKQEELELIGRDLEKAEPILTMAQWLSGYGNDNGELLEEVWQFLKYQREIEEEASIDTLDAVIISKVEEIFSYENTNTLELKHVSNLVAQEEGIDTESNKFNLSRYSRRIRERIEKMGLGKNFRHGNKNVTIFDTSAQLIKETKERYKLDVTNVTNPTNIDNLINLINNANQIIDTILNDRSRLVNEVNEGLSKEVIDKLALMAEKLARLSRLSTCESGVTEKNEKEKIISELKDYLLSHNRTESLLKVWNLLKEWSGKDDAGIKHLVDEINGTKNIQFNFPTQTVILLDDSHEK